MKLIINDPVTGNPKETLVLSVSDQAFFDPVTGRKTGVIASGSQFTLQEEKNWTPGTTDQTIAAGTYCTGAQTIKGDANLIAENIKKGVTIFGVAGSYEGEG